MGIPVRDYLPAIKAFNTERFCSTELALLYKALRDEIEPIEVSARDVFGSLWRISISPRMKQAHKNMGTLCFAGVDCIVQCEGLHSHRITFDSEGCDPHVTFLVTGDPESEMGCTFTLVSICATPLQAVNLLKIFCQQAMQEESLEIKF